MNEKFERRVDYLGCPLDLYTTNQLTDELLKRVRSSRQANIIHFLNANKVAKAHQDPEMMSILREGDFVLADGMPLLPLGKLLGINIPERIDGIGLMNHLLHVASREQLGIYLLGAKQVILDKCCERIRLNFPGLDIRGSRNGYFGKAEEPAIIQAINDAKPDIIFLGMASPKKEQFAYEYRNTLKVPIVQGVGGSFDVMAGLVQRAPVWIQKIGMEWLYRVVQEPRRMFWRYAVTNTQFFGIYIKYVVLRVSRLRASGR